MQTRSKTRIEKGLPKKPVPWLPKKTRKHSAPKQTVKTVNPFKKTAQKKEKNCAVAKKKALQLTRSSFPKRSAIVKITRLVDTIFIKFVRKLASEANTPITVPGDNQERSLFGVDNYGQPAAENIVVDRDIEQIEAEEVLTFNAPQTTRNTPSVKSFMTDKHLSEANSLHYSKTIDLTNVCFNTEVSDNNWILRKFLGLPVPSIESDIAVRDDSVMMGYSPIRANYGTEKLTMNSVYSSTIIFSKYTSPKPKKLQNAPKDQSELQSLQTILEQTQKIFLEAYKPIAEKAIEVSDKLNELINDVDTMEMEFRERLVDLNCN